MKYALSATVEIPIRIVKIDTSFGRPSVVLEDPDGNQHRIRVGDSAIFLTTVRFDNR